MPRGDGKPPKTRRVRRPSTGGGDPVKHKGLLRRLEWWESLKSSEGLGKNVRFDAKGDSYRKPGSQNKRRSGKW